MNELFLPAALVSQVLLKHNSLQQLISTINDFNYIVLLVVMLF